MANKEFESEVLPDIERVIVNPLKRKQLRGYTTIYTELLSQEKEIATQKADLAAKIRAIVGDKTEVGFMVGDIRLRQFSTSRSSLKKNLLLDLGVPPSVICAATTTSESWTLRITKPNGEGEEDE